MGGLFKLKQNGTTAGREIIAGLTTFFAMAYIIVVNPTLLSESGMEWGAVFLATIISSIVGTLVMGLVANVPYAQAPGMGPVSYTHLDVYKRQGSNPPAPTKNPERGSGRDF